jgi:hypothetical protein
MGIFFAVLFTCAIPLYCQAVVMLSAEWPRMSTNDRIVICLLLPIARIAGILLPLVEFNLAIRKWKGEIK